MSDFGGGDVQGSQETGSTGAPSDGGFQQTGGQNQNPGQQQQQQETVDWGANDFLKNVAPEDQAAVQRYLKMIDAGISRRFQSVHEQYRPYQQFGDIEQVQQAMQIAQMLEEDPKTIYDALSEALKDELSQGAGSNVNNGNLDPDLQGALPPEFMAQFQQQQQALQAVAQYILDQQEQQQNMQQDQELNHELSRLKAEFGEFDEEYVLAKAYANGGDLVRAVNDWRSALQKSMTGAGQLQNVPKILGGGGVVPQASSQSVKDLSRSDTQKLVEQLLASQQAQ